MIRIAIQSELEMRRVSYATLLQQYSEFEVVFQANDNKELASQLAKKPVDVVLYCWNSANEIDFNAFDKLSKKHPGLTVLIATQDYYARTFQKVLDRNFMGYFRENSSVNELKKAIHQLCNKGYYYDQKLYDDHKKHIHNCKLNGAFHDEQPTKITKMERFLLPSFFKGLTTKQIGIKYIKNEETIKSHSRNILQKTNSNSMAEACYKLLVKGVVTLEQLMLHLLLAFCLLGNGLDFSDNSTSDNLDSNSSYEWVKTG